MHQKNSELVLVQTTGAQLLAVMEMGIGTPHGPNYVLPYGIKGAGRLLHPAGLSYKADVTREPGNKITEITLNDGGALDPNRLYTVAVSRLMVDTVAEPNFAGCPVTETGLYLSDVRCSYIEAHGEISKPELDLEISWTEHLYELN